MDSSQIPVKRHPKPICSSPGHGHGHAQNGIGPQLSLILCSVRLQKQTVDVPLVQCAFKENCLTENSIHMFHSSPDSQSVVPIPAVPKFHGLEFSGGCTGGNGRPAGGASCQAHFHLHRRIPPGIQYLSAGYRLYLQFVYHKKMTSSYQSYH